MHDSRRRMATYKISLCNLVRCSNPEASAKRPAFGKTATSRNSRGYLAGMPGVGWAGVRGGVSLAAALAVP